MYQQVINGLNQLANSLPWGDVAEFLAVSGVLSIVFVPVYKVVKRFFEHNKGVMRIVVGFVGVMVAFANYVINTPSSDPTIIAFQGLALSFMSQSFYHVGKALLAVITREVTKAVAFNDQVKSASMPVTGLPVVSALDTQDLSH